MQQQKWRVVTIRNYQLIWYSMRGIKCPLLRIVSWWWFLQLGISPFWCWSFEEGGKHLPGLIQLWCIWLLRIFWWVFPWLWRALIQNCVTQVTLITMPLEIGWAITVSWEAGDEMCRIMAFFRIFGVFLFSFILVCIGIDR